MQWRQWIWTYLWSDSYDAILCVQQIVYMNKNGGFYCADRVKDVDRNLFFNKSLAAAYTKFQRMIWSLIWATCSLWPSVTFPDVYMPGDFTGEKLQAYNFEIPGWVKPLQVLKLNSGYDSHDATSPFTFPHPPSDFCPSPFLTRVWGITMEKLWN